MALPPLELFSLSEEAARPGGLLVLSGRRGASMRIGLWIMAALYVIAGIAHFLLVPVYASIIPDFFPAHRTLVLISGAAEIAGGIGVLLPQTRRVAAWGIIALLVAVSPANVHMA